MGALMIGRMGGLSEVYCIFSSGFIVPARTVAGRIGSPVLVLCIGAPAEASCYGRRN